ncbi:MAG: fructose-bisphosphate aldolase, class [Clostridia bacterium]|nr:fructose-bisphosphate aldolase, class [Clostridia bacterium]
MGLVTLTEVLQRAEAGGYAVGAFNCHNLEFIQAIISAAEAEKAPVIIQASQGALQYAGLGYITSMVKAAAEAAAVPVVLHLDHGTDFQQVIRCLRQGFTSVMFDGSRLPLSENIEITRKIVDIAHAAGVSVEGELGRIAGTEDHIQVAASESFYTDPGEAQRFVAETGIDALAVAVGTAHGVYRGEPHLDFKRLQKIRELVSLPLVLHGSSGVPDEAIRKAISLGVRKINIDTDIRLAFVGKLREELASRPHEIDPRKLLAPAREAAREVIRHKMRVFGCSGRA